MKKLQVLAAALAGVALFALAEAAAPPPDTAVYLDQIQVRASAGTRYPNLSVLAIIGGQVTPLQVGPGIILSTATNPPTLGVAMLTPAIETYPIAAAAQTLALAFAPAANTLACSKNGLLMSAGIDYTLAGNVLTFLPDAQGGPGNAPAVGDLFTCAYQH